MVQLLFPGVSPPKYPARFSSVVDIYSETSTRTGGPGEGNSVIHAGPITRKSRQHLTDCSDRQNRSEKVRRWASRTWIRRRCWRCATTPDVSRKSACRTREAPAFTTFSGVLEGDCLTRSELPPAGAGRALEGDFFLPEAGQSANPWFFFFGGGRDSKPKLRVINSLHKYFRVSNITLIYKRPEVWLDRIVYYVHALWTILNLVNLLSISNVPSIACALHIWLTKQRSECPMS